MLQADADVTADGEFFRNPRTCPPQHAPLARTNNLPMALAKREGLRQLLEAVERPVDSRTRRISNTSTITAAGQ